MTCRPLVMALLVVVLAGCSRGERNGEVWLEPVEVQTGEIIMVEREHLFEGGRSGGPLLWARMEFDYRGKHYRWAEEAVWPMLLQIDDLGRPVVASSIIYEWAHKVKGNPCDSRFVHVYKDGSWQQIPAWEMDVIPRANLASNRERGERGESMYKSLGTLGKKFSTAKKDC